MAVVSIKFLRASGERRERLSLGAGRSPPDTVRLAVRTNGRGRRVRTAAEHRLSQITWSHGGDTAR